MKKVFIMVLLVLLVLALVVPACSQTTPTPAISTPAPAKTSAAPTSPLAAITSVAPAAPSTTAASPTTATPQRGGILRIVYMMAPTNIGFPFTMDPTSQQTVFKIALEYFLMTDSNAQFLPTGSVTAYTLSPDRLSYTFTIRKGVKFHDGTDYNAAAAKWNIDQAIAAKTFGTMTWKSVDVVDDYTVRLNVVQPDYTVIGNLGRVLVVISPTAYQKNGQQWLMDHVVGTGPFRLKSFERSASTVFEKNPDYWQPGLPYLDGIRWDYIPDQTMDALALEGNNTDVLWWMSALPASQLGAKGFTTIAPWKQMMYLLIPDSMNATSPLANPKVRQALEYAIDKDGIMKACGYGYWSTLTQMADPHFVAAYNPTITGRGYDPTKAKQMLADAGYAKGFNITLYDQIGGALTDAETAIQKNWSDIGVNLKINVDPIATYNEHKTKGWTNGFMVVYMGCAENYTDTLTRTFATNQTTYVAAKRPDGWADAINTAVASPDFATYQKLTQAAVKLTYDDATLLPLWSYSTVDITNKSVHDAGFFSVNYVYWFPEKTWLSK